MQKIVGGNLILRNMILPIRWDIDNQLITSDGIGVFNCNANVVNAKGHYWGKVTLTPDEMSDDQWDIIHRPGSANRMVNRNGLYF